jgi:NADPH2:quinone reductase
MKAAYIEHPGPPNSLRVGAVPDPVPGPGQALVRVTLFHGQPDRPVYRGGMIKAPLPSPYIVGCDLAGVVEAVGPGATRFKPGERVWGSKPGHDGPPGGDGRTGRR